MDTVFMHIYELFKIFQPKFQSLFKDLGTWSVELKAGLMVYIQNWFSELIPLKLKAMKPSVLNVQVPLVQKMRSHHCLLSHVKACAALSLEDCLDIQEASPPLEDSVTEQKILICRENILSPDYKSWWNK